MTYWLMLFTTVALTAISNLLLKGVGSAKDRGQENAADALFSMILNPRFIVGAICLAIALVPYTIALKKIDLSVAYPTMTTSVMLLVTLCSIIFLHEPLTLVKATGMIVIICGVVLLSSQ